MSDQAEAAPKHPFSRFLGRKYGIIYADPPWPIGLRRPKVKRTPSSTWGGYTDQEANYCAYNTMTVQSIKAIPVRDICADDAFLFIWTFGKFVPHAYEVAEAWGFRPSELLTWCKAPIGFGLGGAFARASEHLLYCRRGHPKVVARKNKTWFEHKRVQKHSAKPHFFRRLILEVCGDLPRIELFARPYTCAYDWDTWGNEMHPDDSAPA
jgi:N6-adenosine-specific RNA methylase IME4